MNIAVPLELYDRFHYRHLLREEWRKTKYLNSISGEPFEQGDTPNKQALAIFERSISDPEFYVCVKIENKMREDMKI